jgi:RoxA-like, cytochrome c-like
MGKSAPHSIARHHAIPLVTALLAWMVSLLPALAEMPAPTALDQGPAWTAAKRDAFYALDQGSRIMPLRWIMALKQPDGSPFMADGLRRYGYLPNEAGPAGLPIGFTLAGEAGHESVGMNCAACHTRQIEVGGKAYRIDGGPAITDFQNFLTDLDSAVARVASDEAAFADFARAVLGDADQPAEQATLREAVTRWSARYHLWVSKCLPETTPWGPGRIDAVGMIFNRLTGLDLGPPPDFVIEANLRRADAPARYPFLWNAAKQDKTQWTGFQPNSDASMTLARNIGQVFGVFAEFHPQKDESGAINFWAANSLDLKGLLTLEALMADIGPPRWPWAIDETLAARGAGIYKTECEGCHGAAAAPLPWKTQITPIAELRTDTRELDLMGRMAASGVLEGAFVPNDQPLQKDDLALRIVRAAVIGSMLQQPPALSEGPSAESEMTPAMLESLNADMPPPGYEARVLEGVWAAAPYLHNGSVPTLADLLKPPAERASSFKIGPVYDPDTVGLAAEQPQPSASFTTTDCSEQGSGNSRCGHEYGTTLGDEDKRALLEFLKKL